MLAEVAVAVEQADRDDRHAEVGGRLQVVAGEHAEAAGVLRQRVADAELGRQVGDRPRPVVRQRRVPGLGAEALRLARDGRRDGLDVAGVGGQLRQARGRRGGQQLQRRGGAGIGRERAEQTGEGVVPLGGEAVGERAERRERLGQDGKGGQSMRHGLTLQGGISQSSAMRSMGELLGESARLAGGVHHDPHGLLGPHRDGASLVIRAWQPGADGVTLVLGDGRERGDACGRRARPVHARGCGARPCLATGSTSRATAPCTRPATRTGSRRRSARSTCT